MDLNTSERNVTAGYVLTPGLVDLRKFMLSDGYHLTLFVNKVYTENISINLKNVENVEKLFVMKNEKTYV